MSTRVYIEDTDVGGVVFYANYLKYMERARTEALRTSGLALGDIQQRLRRLFVVRSVQVTYLAPAHLDDELTVFANMTSIKRASLVCEQPVFRGEQRLVGASVTLACIDADNGRPVGFPKEVADALCAWHDSRPHRAANESGACNS